MLMPGKIDADHSSTARLGVGLVAVDGRGYFRAAAYARTPPWVQTIPAAEGWALWVVLVETASRHKVITGCLGNVRILRQGRALATVPNRSSGRIWKAIFDILEDVTSTDW